MPDRADQLIELLQLQPHPEGGYFREVFRSDALVGIDGNSRSAVTTIFFLLRTGQFSRWHSVDADEIWHFYEGAPLDLFSSPPDISDCSTISLGFPNVDGMLPVHVIPKNYWQAARTTGAYSLVGCSVAPGFRFEGFRFLSDWRDGADLMRELGDDAARLL